MAAIDETDFVIFEYDISKSPKEKPYCATLGVRSLDRKLTLKSESATSGELCVWLSTTMRTYNVRGQHVKVIADKDAFPLNFKKNILHTFCQSLPATVSMFLDKETIQTMVIAFTAGSLFRHSYLFKTDLIHKEALGVLVAVLGHIPDGYNQISRRDFLHFFTVYPEMFVGDRKEQLIEMISEHIIPNFDTLLLELAVFPPYETRFCLPRQNAVSMSTIYKVNALPQPPPSHARFSEQLTYELVRFASKKTGPSGTIQVLCDRLKSRIAVHVSGTKLMNPDKLHHLVSIHRMIFIVAEESQHYMTFPLESK